MGFDVTLFDPVAEPSVLPAGLRVVVGDEPRLPPDPARRPYVVVATQGVWDEEAVASALKLDVAYVGLVASPTRAAAVRTWLLDEGIEPERVLAVRAPAGIDLGAETPEEVAVSILAELVQVRRGRASFVAAPGPATMAGEPADGVASVGPVVDDIVLLDPVCGMTVDRAVARHLAEHDGVVYAFCSIGCRSSFVREPTTYVGAGVETRRLTARARRTDAVRRHRRDRRAARQGLVVRDRPDRWASAARASRRSS